MRSIGASEDDYKILVAKNYIIQMEKGICVITHWWVHNYIQRDRYKETIHLEEKALLTQTETGVYTLDTECVQPVSISASQIRLDKISIDKIYGCFCFCGFSSLACSSSGNSFSGERERNFSRRGADCIHRHQIYRKNRPGESDG